MVLKASDYGFIGLKLKGLIFHETADERTRGGFVLNWEVATEVQAARQELNTKMIKGGQNE
jgi:hypothetical protein